MNNSMILLTIVLAFLITSLSGILFIPFLRKLKFGQTILDIGPRWHKSKQGTPTMGGIMIIFGTIISLVVTFSVLVLSGKNINGSSLMSTMMNTRFYGGILMALGFAFIGFFDDYIKVVKKQNLGLTALQKTLFQLVTAAAYLASLAISGDTTTNIPFAGDIDLGIFYWPVCLVLIYGFVNAVNLTDGIDGLASGVTMLASASFMLIAANLAFHKITLLGAALVGACLGFLFWNFYPAKVFMGDTGSMFLGGLIVALSFGINRPVLLFPIGIVYLFEALSVVIQVAYYKKTRKRLFKMSPIHHHFELCGWSEIKIVGVFSFVTVLGCIVALAAVMLGW